jgi:hypothetical protein
MSQPDPRPVDPTADHIRRVNSTCDRFEDACQAGEPPSVADFLRREGIDPDAAPSDLLTELARLAAAYRPVRPAGGATASYPPGSPPPDGPPGSADRVPGYEILSKLGGGGMGVVYRAHEPTIGRRVAIKVLREEFRANPTAVRRFLNEARITGRLQHPGIPPVFEVGCLADGWSRAGRGNRS